MSLLQRISKMLREESRESKEKKRLKGILDRLKVKEAALMEQLEHISQRPGEFDNPDSRRDVVEQKLKTVRDKIAGHLASEDV